MRKPPSRRWLLGRFAAGRSCPRFTLSQRPRMSDHDPLPHLTPDELRHERPDAHGIRRGLVAHVQKLIADGKYDTPERWEAAQEALFQRVAHDR